jgi:raffinose/stachyose/melibiose transport system permease protein
MTGTSWPAERRSARRLRRPAQRSGWVAAAYLAPVVAIYGLFVFYPVLYAFYLSLMKWDGLGAKTYVGLANYHYIFHDDTVFWTAVRNTLTWTVLSVGVTTALGLALALALNRALPGRSFLRAAIYAPAILATIVVSMMWSWMYNPTFGLVDAVLTKLSLGGLVHAWLGDSSVALFSVFAVSAWTGTGVAMVLFLAGLQTVPGELVEAARVDGAGHAAVFRYVVAPLLRQTFIVVIALAIINSLKSFDLIYAMTYGGPGTSTQLLATWAYFQAFNYHQFGVGSAIAVVLLLLTLVIVVPYVRWASRDE